MSREAIIKGGQNEDRGEPGKRIDRDDPRPVDADEKLRPQKLCEVIGQRKVGHFQRRVPLDERIQPHVFQEGTSESRA